MQERNSFWINEISTEEVNGIAPLACGFATQRPTTVLLRT